MATYYRLTIIGRTGMYTQGDLAATPVLARVAVGALHRTTTDRLGIVEVRELPGTWTDSAGHAHPRYAEPVLVEAETTPGEWTIG